MTNDTKQHSHVKLNMSFECDYRLAQDITKLKNKYHDELDPNADLLKIENNLQISPIISNFYILIQKHYSIIQTTEETQTILKIKLSNLDLRIDTDGDELPPSECITQNNLLDIQKLNAETMLILNTALVMSTISKDDPQKIGTCNIYEKEKANAIPNMIADVILPPKNSTDKRIQYKIR